MKGITVGMACLLCVSGAATAAPPTDVVQRYDRWEQVLRQRVNDSLIYPEAAGGAAGDVLVGFQIGGDGKPTSVVVQRSSGYAIFDEAAVKLISGLGRLGPVPSSNGQVRHVVLKLSYGNPAVTAGDSLRLERADRQELQCNQERARALISAPPQMASNQ